MFKKYLPFIIFGLLVGYVIFDFLSKEDPVNTVMENANVTDVASGEGVNGESPNETSDEVVESGVVVESSQISEDVKYAPEFTLSNLDGETVSLSDYKGKIVILNFWATWCPPCREETPHMQSFYEKNKENGIEILAVNLTNIDDGQQAIEKFVQDYGLTFPILLDEEGDAGMMYETFTIPTSYILDKEGRIFQKIVGPMNEQVMNDLIDALRMYE